MSSSLRHQIIKTVKPHWPVRVPVMLNKSLFHSK